jgi:hypothetical protein
MSIDIDLTKCISVKNIHEQNIQCPFKRKFGEFCGHHKNGKCIKRFDEILISNENIDEINKSVLKKDINENLEELITLDYLIKSPFQKIKVSCLRKFAKLNQITFSSNNKVIPKRILLDEIIKYFQKQDYFKLNISKIIKIQSLVRGRNVRNFYGPGFLNRKIINNEYDLLSCTPVKDIKAENFISIRDNDNFVYAFEITTLKELLEYSKENPYNKKNFSEKNLKIISLRIKSLNVKLESIPEIILTKEQKFKHRILNIFTTIDELGNYTDPSWMTSLTLSNLKKYHYYLQDIWYWSFQASSNDKKRIYPPNGTPFITHQTIINSIKNNDELYEIILKDLEIIISKVNNGIERNDEDRKMGCWIILSALVNVCPEAAESLPHLYQQFENWSPI